MIARSYKGKHYTATRKPGKKFERRLKNMESEQKPTFEKSIARINEIVTLLEKGDAELDKSLALFEEGVKLTETCGRLLDDAEQTVVRLQKAINGEPVESLFDDN